MLKTERLPKERLRVERLRKELVIIGGGPAGMSAAVAAYDAGVRDILILERDEALGGILRQCIHNGFGLHRFGEELTGPEYAHRYEQMVRDRGIACKLHTMVLDITSDRVVTASNGEEGIFTIEAGAVILAMGCRERPRGALNIAGDRPAGIYSAGMAQKLVNMKGFMPGKNVVILGSGDIGLIMARRMTLEGAKVHAVCELMPYSGGLARNIEQCLNDFDIPLKLSHTVVEIHGRERVEGVTIARVDEHRRPIAETREYIPCDTLLLSVGLIPENELTRSAGVPIDRVTNGAVVDQNRQTLIPGIFSCGNVLHVHDLVDFVSEEAAAAGAGAAAYLRGALTADRNIAVRADGNIRYTVPERITAAPGQGVTIYFRVADVFRGCRVVVRTNKGEAIYTRKHEKLAPGEMQSVVISASQLEGVESLTFGLEEMSEK